MIHKSKMEISGVKRHYEYIVVGCGGIGSGTLYWLSKKAGKEVLGLEQFYVGHDHGGSQDHSRIIRLQYHDEKYTRLTGDAYKAWEEVERESGLQLVYKTGGLQMAKEAEMGDSVRAYAAAMDQHNIPYTWMTPKEVMQRFPQFTLSDDTVCLYQKDGGVVDAAMGNAVHIQLARGNGATVLEKCPVTKIDQDRNGATVVYTSQGVFTCRRVIVTAGAWINHVLGSVGVHIPIIVTQEQVTYVATPNIKHFTKENFPVWIYSAPQYDLYGLPIHGNSGSKIGIDAAGPKVTTETRTFDPDPERERVCMDFFKENIPKALGPILNTKTCLYTMTPDRDFVIDTLTSHGWPGIVFCCGAGHAYKFASLLGKILSELAIDGNTQYNIRGFAKNRDAITDTNFKPIIHFGQTSKL